MRKFSDSDNSNWSTSLDKGKTSVKNAYLTPVNFISVKNYGVTGNINSPDKGSTNFIKLNIYDPITKKTYENVSYPARLDPSQVVPAIQQIDDAVIYKILTDNIPTQADLKNLERASKNPL
jgi:hypothetical protein